MSELHTNIEKYLDNELTSAEKRNAESHLTTCAQCQSKLEAQQRLSTLLQGWTLPPNLSTLAQPLHLPAQQSSPSMPGLFAWLSGLIILLAYFITKAVFWLANPLNWASTALTVTETNAIPQVEVPTLWQPIILRVLSEQLGNAGDIAVGLLIPTLLYALAIGSVTILYFTWISLNWGGLSTNLKRAGAQG